MNPKLDLRHPENYDLILAKAMHRYPIPGYAMGYSHKENKQLFLMDKSSMDVYRASHKITADKYLSYGCKPDFQTENIINVDNFDFDSTLKKLYENHKKSIFIVGNLGQLNNLIEYKFTIEDIPPWSLAALMIVDCAAT